MSVKTFTESGKGRKKCPADGCPHFVATVTKKCPCGHEFVKGAKPVGQEAKVIERHETGGRGKKQCPGCKFYVGAKTVKCPCGHTFASKPSPTATRVAAKLATATGTQTEPSKPKPTVQPEPVQTKKSVSGIYPRTRRGIGISQTVIPAGACPAKLKSTDKIEVYAWIERVLSAVEDDRHQLKVTAVKYYVREFYDITADFKATAEKPSKYQIVCGHIDTYWVEGGGEPDYDDDDFELADDPQDDNAGFDDPPQPDDDDDDDDNEDTALEEDDDNFEFED